MEENNIEEETNKLKKGKNNKLKSNKKKDNKNDFFETDHPLLDVYSIGNTEPGFGPRKTECQDTISVIEDEELKLHVFAVFDGHGESGQSVSMEVNSFFTNFFRQEKRRLEWLNSYYLLKDFFNEAFLDASRRLKKSLISYDDSGTCAIVVFLYRNCCYIGNLGDSKAVLYREKVKKDEVLKSCLELSEDHTARNKKEKQRIYQHGGRIYKKIDNNGNPIGPPRIWEGGENATGPGLAITRSFGDYNSKDIGNIESPVIEYFKLTDEDKFIVIGSDGLFDVFETAEICGFINNYIQNKKIEYKDEIVDELIKVAKKRWRIKNQLDNTTSSRDDISSKYQTIIGGALSYYLGLMWIPNLLYALQVSVKLGTTTSELVMCLPSLVGIVCRIIMGKNIATKGGKQLSLIMLLISFIGIFVVMIFQLTNKYESLTTSSFNFYILLLGAMASGAAISNYQLIVNSVFWSHFQEAGFVQALQGGLGSLLIGIQQLILTFLSESIINTDVVFIIMTCLYLVVLVVIAKLLNNPIHIQLQENKVIENDAKIISEFIGQDNFPTEMNFQKALYYKSSLVLLLNHFLAIGGLISTTLFMISFAQNQLGQDFKFGLYWAFLILTIGSASRIVMGKVTDKIGGYLSCQISNGIIILGSIVMFFTSNGKAYSPAFIIADKNNINDMMQNYDGYKQKMQKIIQQLTSKLQISEQKQGQLQDQISEQDLYIQNLLLEKEQLVKQLKNQKLKTFNYEQDLENINRKIQLQKLSFNQKNQFKNQSARKIYEYIVQVRNESNQLLSGSLNKNENNTIPFNIKEKERKNISMMSSKEQKKIEKDRLKEKKQLEEQMLDFDYTDTPIREIQILNITEPGYGGNKTECQDSICILKEFLKDSSFFGIFDGHGESGQSASVDINQFFTNFFHQEKRRLDWLTNYHQQREFIKEAYSQANQQLKKSLISYDKSGTCATTIFIHKNHLYVANLGDSKAILYKEKFKNDLILKSCLELTQDHKPTNKKEKARIIKSGGMISRIIDKNHKNTGPMRIWENTPDSTGPGLAVTRSFGDYEAKLIGNISEPSIEYMKLSAEDKFIVMGSDGLFDVFETAEICGFVQCYMEDKSIKYKDDCAQELLKIAKKRWRIKNQLDQTSSQRDDISIVIIFFNYDKDKKLPFQYKNTHENIYKTDEKSKINRNRLNMNGKQHYIDIQKFQSQIPSEFMVLKQEIKNLKGILAFGNGYFSSPLLASTLRNSVKMDYNAKQVVQVMPLIFGTICRLVLGYNIAKSGGKKIAMILNALSILGVLLIYVVNKTNDLDKLQTSDFGFVTLCFAGLISGAAIANFQLVVNSVFWSKLKNAGRNQAIQAGVGNMFYGLYGLIFTNFLSDFSLEVIYFPTLSVMLIIFCLCHIFLQNPIHIQLLEQKVGENDAKITAEFIGQENFPTEINLMTANFKWIPEINYSQFLATATVAGTLGGAGGFILQYV
ncbi:Protein phosphatase 2C (PP2C)-like domain [Pseudocohnilembus persalinus]|uniref:Protein phosphatase 2C (PP2C)-like domain n=1 Tax=Pseudocohnilembus persalinus TaxID=266149 RepID=A0A0V0QME0_PSEPJ|nr:Protein phosphatase 2C (PP2C)-like domain [Pseudocohnilembus persalinus]|eukprot:KRX03426.1 Protein phosphatase 2C (PP2C)-like domain [Pseudocohnilembus persalinus]